MLLQFNNQRTSFEVHLLDPFYVANPTFKNCFNGSDVPLSISCQQCPAASSQLMRQIQWTNGFHWESYCSFNGSFHGKPVLSSMEILFHCHLPVNVNIARHRLEWVLMEILLFLKWKSCRCFNGNTVSLSIAGQQSPALSSPQLRQISSWIHTHPPPLQFPHQIK